MEANCTHHMSIFRDILILYIIHDSQNETSKEENKRSNINEDQEISCTDIWTHWVCNLEESLLYDTFVFFEVVWHNSVLPMQNMKLIPQ